MPAEAGKYGPVSYTLFYDHPASVFLLSRFLSAIPLNRSPEAQIRYG